MEAFARMQAQSTLQSTLCKGCWQHMRLPVPLRGPGSLPFRAFGIRPSRMNPNTCTICEMMFSRVMKARQVEIDATILFADLRNYICLSRSQSSGAISELLDAFYDECAEAIWEEDGIVNKTMGDAIMARVQFSDRAARPRGCGRADGARDPAALARPAGAALPCLRPRQR